MAIPEKQNRIILKEFFETGDRPTEAQFSTLIDSGVNQIADGVLITDQWVGIGDEPTIGTRLTVHGAVNVKDDNLKVDGETQLVGPVTVDSSVTPSGGSLDVKGNVTLDNGNDPKIYTGNGPTLPHRHAQITTSPEDPKLSGLKAGSLTVAESPDYANPPHKQMVVEGTVGIGTPTPNAAFKLHVVDGPIVVQNGPNNGSPYVGISNGQDSVTLQGLRLYGTGSRGFNIHANQSIGIKSLMGGNVGIGTDVPNHPVEIAGDTYFSNGKVQVNPSYSPGVDNDLATKKYVDDQDSNANQSLNNRITTEVNTLNSRIDGVNTNITNNYATKSEVNAKITPAEVDSKINAALPRGIISMWSGTELDVPTGWHLCDGSNGTPPLSDKFIMAAGSEFNPGEVGGAHTVTLTANQSGLRGHSHGARIDADEDSPRGSHMHRVINAAHEKAQAITFEEGKSSGKAIGSPVGPTPPGTPAVTTLNDGKHTHTISVVAAPSSNATEEHENKPRFYTLAYIMKL